MPRLATSLQDDVEVDVVVVGAGIAALCTAWDLADVGAGVAVLGADRAPDFSPYR